MCRVGEIGEAHLSHLHVWWPCCQRIQSPQMGQMSGSLNSGPFRSAPIGRCQRMVSNHPKLGVTPVGVCGCV